MILNDYDHQRIISESHERSKNFGIVPDQVFYNKVLPKIELKGMVFV